MYILTKNPYLSTIRTFQRIYSSVSVSLKVLLSGEIGNLTALEDPQCQESAHAEDGQAQAVSGQPQPERQDGGPHRGRPGGGGGGENVKTIFDR